MWYSTAVDNTTGGGLMAHEENGFMEYLELQDGSDLVTKSELVSAVREAGFKLSDRQLTFYTSEGLIPLASARARGSACTRRSSRT